MVISVQCRGCGRPYQLKPEMAGKRVQCKQCGAPIDVPAAAGPPQPATAAATIDVRCGGCGAAYRVPAQHAGRQVQCQKCRAVIAVPAGPVLAGALPAGAAAAAAGYGPGMAPGGPPQAPVGQPPVKFGLEDLLEEKGPGKILKAPQVGPGQMLCSSCQEAIPIGAAVCTQCGFDFRVGKKVRIHEDKPRDPRTQAIIDALIALAILFVSVIPLVVEVILVLVLVGMNVQEVDGAAVLADHKVKWLPGWFTIGVSCMFIGGALTVLYAISLLADAFQEGAKQGLLYMFVPFYSLYFICTRWKRCRRSYFMNLIGVMILFPGIVLFAVAKRPEEKKETRSPPQRAVVQAPADSPPQG